MGPHVVLNFPIGCHSDPPLLADHSRKARSMAWATLIALGTAVKIIASARSRQSGAEFESTMWRALYQAFNGFWNPTPELQAAMKLPTPGARFKARWKASWRWPVIWRRLVVMFAAMQLWNVGYLAVRGFETVALEHQERARAAYALEQATQVAWTAQPGSAQDLRARQKMKTALGRLAVSANMPLGPFLAEVTHVEVNPFDQFDDDAGLGEFCKRLDLNRCEHADTATHRVRLNVGALYCQLVLPCWDDLSPTPPAQ